MIYKDDNNLNIITYVADFETRNSQKAIEEELTWVYLWTICRIDDIENVSYGYTIESFLSQDFFKDTSCDKAIVYFHNLKFDGRFIIDYLLRNGFTYKKKVGKNKEKVFKCFIDEVTKFFYISIYDGYGREVQFRDSALKIASSVKEIARSFKTKYKKLEYDYFVDVTPGTPLSVEQIEYGKNDVRIIAEALRQLFKEGATSLTASSDALKDFKNMYGSKFKRHFPLLDSDVDTFCRKAYKGGWCYVKEDIQEKIINEKGSTYDVNSLYPFVMHSNEYEYYGEKTRNLYPIMSPVYYTGEYIPDDIMCLYIAHIRVMLKLKPGFLPTIQIKGNLRYGENEYIKQTMAVEDLWLTNIDLELMFLHYDVDYIEYIDGYKFCATYGIFDSYIEKHVKRKEESEGGKRQYHKIMLNGLYGKFGQSVFSINKKPVFDNDIDYVRYVALDPEEIKGVYVPVSAFCTAYARRWTIYHAQMNYNNFCYSDTDSCHIIGEGVGFQIDDKKLGYWKLETEWTCAKFLKQKTYMEYSEGKWDVKCAGMVQTVKDKFLEEIAQGIKTIDDFTYGLSYDDLTLHPKTVRGGCILVPRKFSIKVKEKNY